MRPRQLLLPLRADALRTQPLQAGQNGSGHDDDEQSFIVHSLLRTRLPV
jgi:hypothetical protein